MISDSDWSSRAMTARDSSAVMMGRWIKIGLAAITSSQASRCPASRGRESSLRAARSEEHTSELQSRFDLVCRLLLEKKKQQGKKLLQSKNTWATTRSYMPGAQT